MKKNNKGITLIALVITIIVLLILAMVSIKLVINERMISRSESSVESYKQNSIDEKAKLLIASAKVMSKSGTVTLDSLKAAAEEENIPYTENDSESITCTIEDVSVVIDINENITIIGKTLSQDVWSIDDNGNIGLKNKDSIVGYSKIIIPNKIGGKEVTGIKAETFSETAIEYISIPQTVSTIESKAFYNCNALTEIQMPGDVTARDEAFSGCTNISKITLIPSSNSTIISSKETNMPWYKTTTGVEIVISEGITEIGWAAFADAGVDNINHITKISIPSTITTFGDYSFSGCTSLSEVNFAEGLKAINNYNIFFNCESLTKVVFPASIEEVADNIFATGCTNLSEIWFKGDKVDIQSWTSGCEASVQYGNG